MKGFAKKHFNLIVSFVINIFFLLFFLLICNVHYELSDDWFFAENIANGHYNFTFCSYFIQALTGVIQKLIYPVNAFILLQIVFGFVAMTSIAYIFLDVFGKKKGLLYVFIIESIFAVNVYSLVTFTKTAAVLAVAGGLMMLWAHDSNKHIGYSIFGIVMVIFGSFYRFKIFYSVLAVFFFVVCGCFVAKLKKLNIKNILESAKEFLSVKTVSLVLAMITLVFSFNYVSKEIIYSTEGMDYYKEYNSLRSSVVDFKMPDYNDGEVKKKFEEIGISENDYIMLRSWYFDDQGIGNIETLTAICDLQESEKGTVKEILINMLYKEYYYLKSLNSRGLYTLAYLVIAFIVLLVYKNKNIFVVGAVTASIGLLYSYLWLGGRVNYRAVFSIWISAIVCLLYTTRWLEYRKWILKIKEKNVKSITYMTITIGVVIALTFTYLTCTIPIEELSQSNNYDIEEIEDYINSSENKTFALGRMPYLYIRNELEMQNPFVLVENEAFDRCVYFGTPYYAHPSYIETLKNVGIENLYTDIIDNDNVYFVDCNKNNEIIQSWFQEIDVFLKYINEQYDETGPYDYELVDVVGGFNIYKIITVK